MLPRFPRADHRRFGFFTLIQSPHAAIYFGDAVPDKPLVV
jgi:hypothetical protein